jgi:hypothetical protein
MSVVPFIIELIKRKRKMNENETVVFNIVETQTESQHPVLKQLNDKIAELETQIETNKATSAELDKGRVETINRIRNEKWDYETRVKNVLIEALEDHDEDTVRYIAEQLNITLTLTKQYEVNVTFTIDVEHEIGEEPDPEWDFDFSVSGSAVEDYSSDVIYSKEIS